MCCGCAGRAHSPALSALSGAVGMQADSVQTQAQTIGHVNNKSVHYM